MNLPDFKTILQKLSVIKNNTSLLMSIIIAFVAVLLFIPTQLLSNKLKTKIEQDSVTSGARKVDTLTNWIKSNSASTAETQQIEAHVKDMNEILNLVAQTTERELLSYDVFPEPDPNGYSPQVFQVFGQRYRKGIDNLIDDHNGGDCPTTVELQRRMEESAASMQMNSMGGGRDSMGMGMGMGMSLDAPMMEMGRGGPYGGGAAMGMGGRGGMGGMPGGQVTYGSELERTIVDEICRGRAGNLLIYVNPQDLGGYDFWANYKYDVIKEDGIEDCWYYQLAYWVIDDVFQTVDKMNAGHENVMTAPLKRIMNVSFVPNLLGFGGGGIYGGMGRMAAGQSQSQSERPKYVLSANEGLAESCTGRFSDATSEFDVIHFNLIVVVDAKSVMPFIQELCSSKEHVFRGYPDGQDQPQQYIHNQITVLESKMGSVVPDDYLHAYYRYGDAPVVELELVSEYLFDREGYAPIKPETVKETLSGETSQ